MSFAVCRLPVVHFEDSVCPPNCPLWLTTLPAGYRFKLAGSEVPNADFHPKKANKPGAQNQSGSGALAICLRDNKHGYLQTASGKTEAATTTHSIPIPSLPNLFWFFFGCVQHNMPAAETAVASFWVFKAVSTGVQVAGVQSHLSSRHDKNRRRIRDFFRASFYTDEFARLADEAAQPRRSVRKRRSSVPQMKKQMRP